MNREELEFFTALIERIIDAMSALDDRITALTDAVTADGAATKSLIEALAANEPTAAQLAALDAQTAAVAANTTAINTALNPPPAPPPAA